MSLSRTNGQAGGLTAYDGMAVVYDALIEDVDYRTWYAAFSDKLGAMGKRPYRLLEIGAGTGNMTEHLVASGCHVTALEPSEAMLSVLQEKMGQDMGRMRFFNGHLADFKTVEKFDGVVAFLDVFNYIAPQDLTPSFKQVAGLLEPGGILVFDISTPYKLEHILGHNTFAENHEEFAFIWENRYDAKKRRLTFEFALFTELEDGAFERSLEAHTQFAHTQAAIFESASQAGFELFDVFGDNHSPTRSHNGGTGPLADALSESQRWHFYFIKKEAV